MKKQVLKHSPQIEIANEVFTTIQLKPAWFKKRKKEKAHL